MELDVSFLGTEGSSAPAENPNADPSVIESAEPSLTPAPELTPEPGAEAVPAIESPTGDTPNSEEEPLDEADLEKLLADNPNSPKWFRDQLKKVQGYTGKLKTEKTELQQQIENLRSEYEGKSALAPEDLERMRLAEEAHYKLSSYTAPVEDVLASLKEVVNPNKLAEIKSIMAWEFLETPTGEPDLENLQVIIDRFSGAKAGESPVAARDVLNAIQALKRGTVKPEELHEFSSDAEYNAYMKAREIEKEAETQRELIRENAQFQETQTRLSVLQNVYSSIQNQFQPQVENLFNKFQLAPVENEPKVAAEFKQAIRQRVAQEINQASLNNASLADVFNAIELLSKPTGLKADAIQREIESYTNSFPYRTALSRGMSELMQTVEKTITQEAYRYKLMMMGYEQEVSKGQNAREVIGQPKQTEVLTSYTPEQLAAMSAAERRHAKMMEISNQLRGKNVPRYGG